MRLAKIERSGQEPMRFHSECTERRRGDWWEFELTHGRVIDVLLEDIEHSRHWRKRRLFHLEIVREAKVFAASKFKRLNELGAHQLLKN